MSRDGTLRSILVAGVGIALVAAAALTLTLTRDRGSEDSCLSVPRSHERVVCLRPGILDIARRESPRRAVEAAYDYQTKGVISECHLLAHAVGEDLYARAESDAATGFAACSDKCVQGCYHGFMSRLLPSQVKRDDLSARIGTLCASVRGEPIAHKQCVHGIGHGLLTHGYLSRREAIDICRRLGSPLETDACLDGVFMENMFPFLELPESAVVARLPEACDEIIAGRDPDLIAQCLFEVADGLMFYTDYDLDRTLRMCEGLRDPDPIDICRRSARQWKSVQLRQAQESRTGR